MSKNQLSMLKEKIAALEHTLSSHLSASYQCRRNEKAELMVSFEDGQEIKLPFIPFRNYQTELNVRMFIDGIKRALLERPRRSGKEVESWNITLMAAIESPGLYMMVYPTNVRARAVLWDGAVLLPNNLSIKFLDMIPIRMLAHKNKQEMKITLINGSIIWIVGSDIDVNKLRGTNPRGIAYCEFAFQDPRVFYIMLPVLRQNNGWLIAQSTFDGMNHFYQLIKNNEHDPLWYCRVDSITNLVDDNGQRYITDEMIEEDRRAGMPEYLIQQEYYGNVQINQETKYFAHAINNLYEEKKIIADLYLPNAVVYAALDIGINDSTAVTMFQVTRVGGYLKPKVINYFEANNRDLAYYVTEVRRACNRFNLTFKDYFIPHDGQKRDFNTGKNTIDFLRDMGENGYIVPRPTSKENAIEAMRRMLYLCEFNKENTQRLIDCLTNYSKEFDESAGIYKSRPVHNWASHGVDSFQTMTLAIDGDMIADKPMDVIYINQ